MTNAQVFFMILIHVDVIALANRLYGLPLAIVVAGSFMRETRTSITEYLQYYQESWPESPSLKKTISNGLAFQFGLKLLIRFSLLEAIAPLYDD